MQFKEYKKRKISEEEYLHGLSNEIKYTSLIDAVEERCDKINDLCHYMSFKTHRNIQELLIEILDLVKIREKQRR